MTTTGTKAERGVRLISNSKDRASHLMQGASRNLLRTPAYFGSAIIAASILAAAFAPSTTAQGTFNLTSGTQTYNTTTNWSNNAVPYGQDAIATFQSPTATESVTTGTTVDIVGTINETDGGSSALTLASGTGGGFNFSASSGNAAFNVSGNGSAANVLSAACTLTSMLDVTIANTPMTSGDVSLQITGTLSGKGSFIKDGDGAVTFANVVKTYSGSTTINAGILYTSPSGAANATSGVTVNSAGTLSLLPTANNQTLQFGASAATTIALNGPGATRLAGSAVSAIGALALTTRSMTLSNNIVLASDSQISSATNLILTLTGTISGTGGLTISGASGSTVSSSSANTYTGSTNVNSGTLLLSTGNINTSTAVAVASGGVLTLQNATALADTSSLSLVSGATLNLSAAGGTSEVIGSLYLDGKAVAPGTYKYSDLSGIDGAVGFSGDSGETLTVTGVPEPATAVGSALMVGALGFSQRHRLGRLVGLVRSC